MLPFNQATYMGNCKLLLAIALSSPLVRLGRLQSSRGAKQNESKPAKQTKQDYSVWKFVNKTRKEVLKKNGHALCPLQRKRKG